MAGVRRQFRQVHEANPVACHRPQRLDLQQLFHLHRLNGVSLAADRRPELNRRRLGHHEASRLHRLSEIGADLVARLRPGQKPARLKAHRAKWLRQVSELHRPRRDMASHQEACDKAQLQVRGSLAGLRTCKSKIVVERPRCSVAQHRLPRAQVLVNVAAAHSEHSLARRLRGLVRVNRVAQKNADNPASTDLRRHHLPVQVQAKREVQEREGKAPMVNLAANQEPERLLLLSAGKCNLNGERKKARGPHRHDHNQAGRNHGLRGFNGLLILIRVHPCNPWSKEFATALFERRFVGCLCQPRKLSGFTEWSGQPPSDIDGAGRTPSDREASESNALQFSVFCDYSSSAICTALSAAPLSN